MSRGDRAYATDKTADESRRFGHNAKPIVFHGKRRFLKDICREYGVSYKLVHRRINRGWKLDKALKTPWIRQRDRFKKSPIRLKCEELGIDFKFVYDRIRGGMSPEEAISRPKMSKDSPDKKRTIRVELDGVTYSVAGACRKTGVDQFVARVRISRLGWDPLAAVTVPSDGGDRAEATSRRNRRKEVELRRREMASLGLVF